MSNHRTILFVVLALLLLSLPACAADTRASSGGSERPPEPDETTARQEEDTKNDRPGGGSGGEDRGSGGNGGRGDGGIESATLTLRGDEGTGFSGSCEIGGEEREIRGTVPDRVELELNGEPLECGIENTGPGILQADLTVGNSHYKQTTSGGSSLNFVLSGTGYSSSTSSVTSVETETSDAVSNSSSSVVVVGPED